MSTGIFTSDCTPLNAFVINSNLVRHSTARVIAAVASVEVPLGQWNELLPFMEQTCRSPSVSHREVGIYILYTVLENIVEGFESYMQNLFKLFEALLADPESAEVRITTVRYVIKLLSLSWTNQIWSGLWALSHSISTLSTRMRLYVILLSAFHLSCNFFKLKTRYRNLSNICFHR